MTNWQTNRKAFVDTSAFYALAVPSDASHASARQLMHKLGAEAWDTWTTNVVLAETHALLLSRLRRNLTPGEARRRSREFIRGIYDSKTTIVRITEDDERRALDLLFRRSDQDFSLTDALSFTVMERLGIRVALTFDSDFTRAGFTDLRHV